MRKLIAAGTVLAFLALAPASHGALVNIEILDNEFNPTDASFEVLPSGGPNFVWDWDGMFDVDNTTVNQHNVVQKKGLFRSGDPTNTSDQFELNASAGKFPYFCEVHRQSDDMKGKIRAAVRITDVEQDRFKVFWASDVTTTGKRFDVRYRVDEGKWKNWKKDTKKFAGRFGKNGKPVEVDTTKHEYDIAARSEKGKPSARKRSGWSPPASPVA